MLKLVLPLVFLSTLIFPATSGQNTKFKDQTLFELAPDIKFECVLLRYTTDNCPASHIKCGTEVVTKLGGGRVITIPSDFIPVIIPESRIEEAKRIFGPSILPLTEGMEWSKQ